MFVHALHRGRAHCMTSGEERRDLGGTLALRDNLLVRDEAEDGRADRHPDAAGALTGLPRGGLSRLPSAEWITRPHGPGGPARRRRAPSGPGSRTRANVWRYDPGAKGRRHRHPLQEETFVVLAGTLTMYLGDPPERVDVRVGGIVHVDPGTALQSANHGDEELVVYAHGWPPESEHAEILDPAV